MCVPTGTKTWSCDTETQFSWPSFKPPLEGTVGPLATGFETWKDVILQRTPVTAKTVLSNLDRTSVSERCSTSGMHAHLHTAVAQVVLLEPWALAAATHPHEAGGGA